LTIIYIVIKDCSMNFNNAPVHSLPTVGLLRAGVGRWLENCCCRSTGCRFPDGENKLNTIIHHTSHELLNKYQYHQSF